MFEPVVYIRIDDAVSEAEARDGEQLTMLYRVRFRFSDRISFSVLICA